MISIFADTLHSSKTRKLLASRLFWIFLAILSASFVLCAHFVFSELLFMRPCARCVVIRFWFCVLAFGFLLCAINPLKTRKYGAIVAFLAAIFGALESWELALMYAKISTNDPFIAMRGCGPIPHFPLGMRLDLLFPVIFSPTGECGMDFPFMPPNTDLHAIQAFFIKLYSQNWYLIPQIKFLNMAQATFFVFCGFGLYLIYAALCVIAPKIPRKNKTAAVFD